MAEGDTDVEYHAKSEPMSLDTTEVATQEVEVMDAESQGEAIGELAGLDTQAPSPQAHPWGGKQNANEETAGDPWSLPHGRWAQSGVTGIGVEWTVP